MTPGESTTLTAILPEGDASTRPVVQVDGWNRRARHTHADRPQSQRAEELNGGRRGTHSLEPIGLKRSLRFWDLVLYGIILIQPTAPMPIFGVIYQESRGHVVTAILLAMVAMLFTSVSYGRMARAYPHGGSAFLYVGKEIHPSLGYITGWCLVMDYVLNPLICTIWCSRAAINFLPEIPYVAWAIFFALLLYVAELQWRRNLGAHQCRHGCGAGHRDRARARGRGSLGSCISRIPARRSSCEPFYDPRHIQFMCGLLRGTSIAVLTYIGFDGISTLTDEAKDPARSVPRAIVLTCFITGVLASIEVYVAQLVWPRGTGVSLTSTRRMSTSRDAWVDRFCFYRERRRCCWRTSARAWPRNWARRGCSTPWDRTAHCPDDSSAPCIPKNRIPRNNVLLIGAICLAGRSIFSYQLGTELLNYGALLAFMGVNLASMLRGWRHGRWSQTVAHARFAWPAWLPARVVVESRPHGKDRGHMLGDRRHSALDRSPTLHCSSREKPHDRSAYPIRMIGSSVVSMSRWSAIQLSISCSTGFPKIFLLRTTSCWPTAWPFALADQERSPRTISPLSGTRLDSSPRFPATISAVSASRSCTGPESTFPVACRSRIHATGVTVHLQHKVLRHMFTYAGATFQLCIRPSRPGLSRRFAPFPHVVVLPAASADAAYTRALSKAQNSAGVTISLDPNDDPAQTWDRSILEALELVDVLMPNEREACRLAGEPNLDRAISCFANVFPCSSSSAATRSFCLYRATNAGSRRHVRRR